MPSNILNADTGFPSFTEDMTSDQKIDRVMNYLYMLLEQLRYTLANLGVDNFNGAEINDLAKIITDPVYIQLEDGMGNLTSLQLAVDGITSRVVSVEGGMSEISSKADANASEINLINEWRTYTDDTDGKLKTYSLSEISSKADANASEINFINEWRTYTDDTDGKLKTYSLSEISSKASDNGSFISQLVEEMGEDGKVTTASIVAAVNDSDSSVQIKADKIKMTGTTTFLTEEDVGDSGTTEIAGNRLSFRIDGTEDDGETSLTSKNGLYFKYDTKQNSSYMGHIRTSIDGEDSDIESRYALEIASYGFVNNEGQTVRTALKLSSVGRMSLEANGIYLGSGYSLINPQKVAFITLDAIGSTRIFAHATYENLDTLAQNGYDAMAPYTGYVFCTDGIYYNGAKILNV